ncbi:MAG: hypothetical protein M1839_005685 [Geoglossum umbratile]|nr:MAG: hypothetical protein M1839_005685 [Geoglossum umbratile]
MAKSPAQTSNYHKSSILIETILKAEQAWGIVTGEEQPPNPPAATAGPVAQDQYEEKLSRYLTRHAKAATIILQSSHSCALPPFFFRCPLNNRQKGFRKAAAANGRL